MFKWFVNIAPTKAFELLETTFQSNPILGIAFSLTFRNMQNVGHKTRSFLENWLDLTVKDYVKHMHKDQNGDLHGLIIGGVEKPLLDIVIKETNGNQTHAATILGINRNTLRKKIKEYKIQCPKKA